MVQNADLACWQQYVLADLNFAEAEELPNQESRNPHTPQPLLHQHRKNMVVSNRHENINVVGYKLMALFTLKLMVEAKNTFKCVSVA